MLTAIVYFWVLPTLLRVESPSISQGRELTSSTTFFALFAIRYSGIFAVRYSLLFAIRVFQTPFLVAKLKLNSLSLNSLSLNSIRCPFSHSLNFIRCRYTYLFAIAREIAVALSQLPLSVLLKMRSGLRTD